MGKQYGVIKPKLRKIMNDKQRNIHLEEKLDWITFETQIPPAFLEVLLYCPNEQGGGYVRVGYFDPEQQRIALATAPINTLRFNEDSRNIDDIELLKLADAINKTNPDFSSATHWKYLEDFPIQSSAEMTAEDVLEQRQAVNKIKK